MELSIFIIMDDFVMNNKELEKIKLEYDDIKTIINSEFKEYLN